MIVVSDTTPVHYLVLIGEIDLLAALFERVIIPQAVFDEMQHQHTPQPVKEWIAANPAWLEVRQADPAFVTPLSKLGVGELEAIALALELNADAILIDDKKGKREADRNSLKTITTLTLLELAAELGRLDLPEALKRLSNTNFRFPSDDIVETMLERDRQRK